MKTKVYSLVFLVVFALNLFAEYSASLRLINFSKPLIVLVLVIWLSHENLRGRFRKRILAGLIFAWIGDFLLLFQYDYPSFFMYGLIAFLICHIFYIRAFILDHKSNPLQKNPYFLWSVGGFAIFCSGLFFYMQPKLGPMQFPILMFALIISLMGIMAVNRFGKVNMLSFKLVLYGAVFFLFSDTVLAYAKFVQPFNQSGSLVISTYMIAQYLIVYGTIERKLVVTRTEV